MRAFSGYTSELDKTPGLLRFAAFKIRRPTPGARFDRAEDAVGQRQVGVIADLDHAPGRCWGKLGFKVTVGRR